MGRCLLMEFSDLFFSFLSKLSKQAHNLISNCMLEYSHYKKTLAFKNIYLVYFSKLKNNSIPHWDMQLTDCLVRADWSL
mgnify:FL=1